MSKRFERIVTVVWFGGFSLALIGLAWLILSVS